MVLTGCLSWRNAAAALNPAVILLIVVSLALGTALVKTGAAQYIAEVFVAFAHGASPAWILSGLMAMMAVFTNVIANNAAGAVRARGVVRRQYGFRNPNRDQFTGAECRPLSLQRLRPRRRAAHGAPMGGVLLVLPRLYGL